ncbi:dihydropteroate synthase [Synechococcus sp. PCC 7336]|uniref:dihydropteroate synthase n=1 Tax=Synechococcus sp. PCC 7336 TaxID=195250 RepID=UPI003510047B
MRLRVTAVLPEPPGGYQLYVRSVNDEAQRDRLQQLSPQLEWHCSDGGWRAWLPLELLESVGAEIGAAIDRYRRPPTAWQVRNKIFVWGDRTYLMGVLNITPDSFSDGGQYDRLERAVGRALQLIDAGADMLDIGGESSRPGAQPVDAETEIQRVVPTIRALRQLTDIPISIDTTKAAVLEAAIAAGADILNDISAGQLDPDMLPTAARLNVPVFLMHMQGTPRTMQQAPHYRNVVDDVYDRLADRIADATAAGIDRDKIAIDLGIGFGKTVAHNLDLIRHCDRFRSLGCPLLLGVSRKSFLGKILAYADPLDRVWGTGAACAVAIAGGADCLRVHDVAQMRDISRVSDALLRQKFVLP